MATFQYTAKRALVSGHSVDLAYTIEVGLSDHIQNDKVDAVQKYSHSKTETIFHGLNTHHQITTEPMDEAARLEFREFLLSASSGEDINFDLLGTIANPNNVLVGKLVPQKSLKYRRFGNLYYAYSFEVREV